MQYRLKEVDGGTLITLRHTALGLFPPDGYREALGQGWTMIFERLRRRARAGVTRTHRKEGHMATHRRLVAGTRQEAQTTRRVLERVPDDQLGVAAARRSR